MEFIDKITPFIWIEHDDGTSSITLYADQGYKKELFQTRRSEGFTGSGYDWESLAQVLIREIAPDLSEAILFDPERGMFCAYSHNTDELRRFAILLKETCENNALIADIFSRAAPDESVADGNFLRRQEQLAEMSERLSNVTLDNLPSDDELEEMKKIIKKMEEEANNTYFELLKKLD